MKSKLLLASVLGVGVAMNASAQDSNDNKVAVHGSIQSDILVPEEDESIGTGKYDSDVLTNTYVNLNLNSKYVDAGARFEFLEYPLPGFEPDFKGWGVPNIYVTGKYKNMELTVGDMYEQFGSGFILRTYEERSLGVDNSLRGARLRLYNIPGVKITALGGIQRTYWDWNRHNIVGGADVEMSLDEYSSSLRDRGITWSVGASYVQKHEKNTSSIMVPGTDYELNLPENVNAFDVRTNFNKGNFSLLAEYAMKSHDPSNDNGYIYRHGNAVMLSASYSNRSFTSLLQVKRSEDMAFRSQRNRQMIAGFINNMPAFAYQHTYSLAAMYPYATQAAPGEWAFQGEFSYNFKRKTALGGKYGTKLRLNISHVRGLHKTPSESALGTTMGGEGYKTSFFKMGETYYQDINLQLDKKITKNFKLNAMYINQRYNQGVIEGHNDMVNSNIFVLEGKWNLSKKTALRTELQYLTTKQDKGDWAYALAELSVLPHLMFTVSDMWNCGETDIHYYMGLVTYTVKSHRFMLGYGKTRAGYNCSGGVCRYVPATKGLSLSYNYTF